MVISGLQPEKEELPKEIIDQNILIPIFIAYLKLQLKIDSEKVSRGEKAQYHQRDIDNIINNIKEGFCNGFSALMAHKLRSHKLKKTADELNILRELSSVGFNEDGSFRDNGKFLMAQSQAHPKVARDDQLNRINNPMVELLEDIFSNINWLQQKNGIHYISDEELYQLTKDQSKAFSSFILKEEGDEKAFVFSFREALQLENAELRLKEWDSKKASALKNLYQEKGETAALHHLNQLLGGALEKELREKKSDILTQEDWDKLINLTVDKETPKLESHFALTFVFKKNEIEKTLNQIFSSFENESTKIINLKSSTHATMLYKEKENYYFMDPNDGKLCGPFPSKNAAREITQLIFKCLFHRGSDDFGLGIKVFEESFNNKLLNPGELINGLLQERKKNQNESLVDLTEFSTGLTSLHLASKFGNVEVVQTLLANGANIEAIKDLTKLTALHFAAAAGQLSVVEALLDAKADITAKDVLDKTALHWAAEAGYVGVLKTLLKANADITAKDKLGNTPLHLAAKKGHVGIVESFLKANADLAVKDKDGYTLLHLAAQNGHVSVVEALLKAKADVTTTDNFGQTPLHMAAQNGHVSVVEALLKAKADVTTTDNFGQTPLHMAAQNGHVSVVEALLKAKADVTTTDSFGQTPLHMAALSGSLGVVKALLKAKANVRMKDGENHNLLHMAVLGGNIKIVRIFLDKMDIMATNIFGETPFHMAAGRGSVEIVEALLKASADITTKTNLGNTPLHMAAQFGHRSVVEALLKANADVDTINSDGRTPLHIAALRGKAEAVEALIKGKANMMAKDDSGNTPLHLAVIQGHEAVIKTLLKAAAKKNMSVDYDALSGLARTEKIKEILNVLPKEIINQNILIRIFVAYLKLQLKMDSEKVSRGEKAQYDKVDIENIINDLKNGICVGFSILIAHKLRSHKLKETADDLDILQKLFHVGFNKDGSFRDHGKFLMAQSEAHDKVPRNDRLNRINNPMVALLEDILSNIRWFQQQHGIRYIPDDEIYKLTKEQSEAFSEFVLKEEGDEKAFMATCREALQLENAELRLKEWDGKKANALKLLYQEKGEAAALHHLNQLLGGAFEKELREKKSDILTQEDWDKLINLTVDKETPKLQSHFALSFVFKKDEIEKTLNQIFSSFEKEPTKIINLNSPTHSTTIFKEKDHYYFMDPNDGKLYGPFPSKEAARQITQLIFEYIFHRGSDDFGLGIKIFEESFSDKLPPPGELINELLEDRRKNQKESLVDLTEFSRGLTSLHLASRAGNVEVVRSLLANGANIEATGSTHHTALRWAALEGQVDVVEALLKAKADITAKDKFGNAALHLAAMQGHVGVVNALLKAKADITVKDELGSTPLHLATERGHIEVVKVLLKANADLTARDEFGNTPLHLAAKNGHVAMVIALLKAKADITTINNSDYTPLHLAAESGQVGAVEALLKADADVTTTDSFGQTPLHMAALEGHVGVVKILLDKGNIMATNRMGKTALHMAAVKGDVEIVKTLLKAKANILAKDDDGNTPLHLAVQQDHEAVIKTLLTASARANVAVDYEALSRLTGSKKTKEILGAYQVRRNRFHPKVAPSDFELIKSNQSLFTAVDRKKVEEIRQLVEQVKKDYSKNKDEALGKLEKYKKEKGFIFDVDENLNLTKISRKNNGPKFSIVFSNHQPFILYRGKSYEGEERLLGKGHFGRVKLAQNYDTHELVAVKIQSDKSQGGKEEEVLNVISRENIKGHLIRKKDKEKHYLFQPLHYGEDAKNLIKTFTIGQALDFFRLAAEKINSLHRLNLIHRDLHLSNFMFDSEVREVHLVDYGHTVSVKGNEGVIVEDSTKALTAPEVASRKEYSKKSDIYAFGKIMEMILDSALKYYVLDNTVRGQNKETIEYVTRLAEAIGKLTCDIVEDRAENFTELLEAIDMLQRHADKGFLSVKRPAMDKDYFSSELDSDSGYTTKPLAVEKDKSIPESSQLPIIFSMSHSVEEVSKDKKQEVADRDETLQTLKRDLESLQTMMKNVYNAALKVKVHEIVENIFKVLEENKPLSNEIFTQKIIPEIKKMQSEELPVDVKKVINGILQLENIKITKLDL